MGVYLRESYPTYRQPAPVNPQLLRDGATGKADLSLASVLKQLDTIESVIDSNRSRGSAGIKTILSSQPLQIHTEDSPAQLESTQEITRFTSDYAPKQPTWNGLSSAELSISGDYDGALGGGNLTFNVQRGGVIGLDTIELAVVGPNGENIGVFDFTSADEAVAIGHGLTLSLGAGLVANADSTDTTLSVDYAASPNVNGVFNESGNPGPGFENGYQVNAGSFTINDQMITVAEDDTITTVLNKINVSSAMVLASYDEARERITLVHTLSGDDHEINLESDTSGFLEATKLSDAVYAAGAYDDTQRPLTDVAAFSAVSSGTYRVNDTAYTLDTVTDTVESVVHGINQAPLLASLTTNKRKLSLSTTGGVESLVLQSGSTGLFAAFHINDGQYDLTSNARLRGVSKARSYEVANALEAVVDVLKKTDLDSSRSKKVANAITEIIENIDTTTLAHLKRNGLEITDLENGLFISSQENRKRFTHALQDADRRVVEFLNGRGDEPGFIDKVRQVILDTYRADTGFFDFYA